MLAAHFRSMAAYNRWANRRLYDAASRVSDEAYRSDRGAFFRSLHGTLNHILVGDRIWLSRITGRGEAPAVPEFILYERLADLTVAREEEDERLAMLIARLDAAALSRPVTYRNLKGVEFTNPLAALLAHLFNHQTHHRGQAHGILTQLGQDAPSLDMVQFYRANP
jgi:uncharacterized damage-inducible protein DinB